MTLEEAQKIEEDQINNLLKQKDLTLTVRVHTREDADQLLAWIYSKDKPMSAELLALEWNKSVVSKKEADLLEKMREILAYT